jgi:hypothetical protein
MQQVTVRRWLAAAVVVAVSPTAFGCSDEDEEVGTSGDPTEEQTAEVETVEEDPTDVDDPTQFAFGQEVKVVEGGVEPKLLAADKDAPIFIRNTTDAPVEVRFTNPGWDHAGTTTTGALPPGGTFELDPIGVASITYELVGPPAVEGIIQVEDGLDDI